MPLLAVEEAAAAAAAAAIAADAAFEFTAVGGLICDTAADRGGA